MRAANPKSLFFFLRMVRWCVRPTRLTLVCEVIRYRLVQVRQNLKKKIFKCGFDTRNSSKDNTKLLFKLIENFGFLAVESLNYCKTPLISTYVSSFGLATEHVLIFGAVLTFGGYDKAEAKILQGRSLFNPVLSAHNTLLRMFQRLCTYFQDTGVLIFGGYVLSGHCNQQQISVKTEGVLIFGGVLIYGVLRYCFIPSDIFQPILYFHVCPLPHF